MRTKSNVKASGHTSITLRALLFATVITLGGLATTLARPAFFATTLHAVRGGGEFETLETTITVGLPEQLKMQWATDQAGATGGTWRVLNTSAGNIVVATGETGPAPGAGKVSWFTIPANAFLLPQPPQVPVQFGITVTPHNAANQPVGPQSAPVFVSQVAGGGVVTTTFGPSAVFPSVKVVSFKPKIIFTNMEDTGANISLLVSNKGQTKTDPIWLGVRDKNVLMFPTELRVKVPGLPPGTSKLVKMQLTANLPPPELQFPPGKQYAKWYQKYKTLGGVDLRAIMDWRGPQANTPINDHLVVELVP